MRALLPISFTKQVWCADITYVPLAKGFLYLVAIMDWASRKVLAGRLSNTMEAQFCIDALEEALGRCFQNEKCRMKGEGLCCGDDSPLLSCPADLIPLVITR